MAEGNPFSGLFDDENKADNPFVGLFDTKTLSEEDADLENFSSLRAIPTITKIKKGSSSICKSASRL